MSDEKKPFTVSDRRHFTPEGESRTGESAPAAEDEETPRAGSTKPTAAGPGRESAAPPPAGSSAATEARREPAVETRREPAVEVRREPSVETRREPAVDRELADPASSLSPGVPADFVGLLLSLGTQAAMLLGQPPGDAAAAAADLEAARALISLLEVLKDKSEGRRTPEEEEVLQGLLYQLRLAYVARTRVGGR
jgi:hypothetical protein